MAQVDRVPFLPGRHLIVVRAVINDRERPALLVDTGAVRSAISQRIANVLQIDLSRPLRREVLVGVGRTGPLPVVSLDRVQVGLRVAERLTVSVLDLPPFFGVDGILGLDFLRRFRMTVGVDTRTLILREPPASPRRTAAVP